MASKPLIEDVPEMSVQNNFYFYQSVEPLQCNEFFVPALKLKEITEHRFIFIIWP